MPIVTETKTSGWPDQFARYDAVRRAREAVDEAIIGRAVEPRRWLADLSDALRELTTVLERHREASEAPGGPLEELLTLKPGLGRSVARQRREHVTLLRDAHVLLAEIDVQAEAQRVTVAALRRQAWKLQDAVRRHMATGVDLIYEAHFVDEGVAG